jgi:hypothetical protein
MKRLILIFAILALSAACTASGLDGVVFNWPPPPTVGEKDFFVVAKAGKAACRIVIPASPTQQDQNCAQLLKLYLDLVTGGSFEIRREPAEGPAIYLGETAVGKKVALDLPPVKYASITLPNLHGFMIETVDRDSLVIRGAHDVGVSYGAVAFLRDYLGVRRYWPTEPGGFGDVYERKPDFTVPKLEWRDWPYFIGRHVGYNPKGWELTSKTTDVISLLRWNRDGFPLSMMHNLNELISPQEYGKTHPEYFPEFNGVRFIPTSKINWQPCISNPEVVDICARKIIASFDKDPLRICCALAVNDGMGDCTCVKCRAMDAPDADANTWQLTDRYVKFMNAVAEKVAVKYPDRLIGFLSYASITYPPTTVKLAKNLIPFHCAMARGIYQDWDKWIAAGAANMGHYGYHDDMWFTLPKINPHQEAKRIRFAVASNAARGYYKEFNPTYPLDAQSTIIVSDMLWDPRLDENAILSRYYSDMFGEASSEMRTFYETLESDYEAWLRQTAVPTKYGYDRSDIDLDHSYNQFEVLSSASADRAWEALLAAEAKARDPKVRERISLVRSIFQFVRMCDQEYWHIKALDTASNAKQAEKLARETLWLAREKAKYKETVVMSPSVWPWMQTKREPFDQIKVGVIPQEVRMAIDQAFDAAYHAKPGDAMWRRLAGDADPVISESARAVLALAAAKAKPDLIDDGGFEGPTPPQVTDNGGRKASIRLVTDNPHTGRQCAMFYDCLNSSIVKKLPSKAGEKYWVSLWVRAKDYQGSNVVRPTYLVRVDAKKAVKTLDWVGVRMQPTEKWQQVRFSYTTPANTERIEVQITAIRQHAKARLWLDDFSVIRVPMAPVAPSPSSPANSEPAPPET